MEFQDFYTYLITEKRSSAHTVEAYKSDLAQFSEYSKVQFEISDYQEVTAVVVRSWLASLMEQGYQSSSVHRKISSINACYRFLLKNGKVAVNPAKGISKPKMPKRLPHFVEEKAMLTLYRGSAGLQDFPSIRNELILHLFYETGIRLSELMQLTDRDIDSSIGQIKVLGKRNKMRFVPVGKDTLEKINRYVAERNRLDLSVDGGFLIVSDKGKKISKTFVYNTVKSYLSTVTTQAKKSPHVLRHTFATHMLNNGADLNVIKEILGHSSLAATQVYTHNSIEKLKGIHKTMHPRSK
jgi:integrase/recombinase XerC